MSTMMVNGKEYTPEEIFADHALMEAMVAEAHAERYPDGCRVPGHRCEACAKRVGDTPHPYVKVGARRGYKGQWVCNEPRCPYYRS